MQINMSIMNKMPLCAVLLLCVESRKVLSFVLVKGSKVLREGSSSSLMTIREQKHIP